MGVRRGCRVSRQAVAACLWPQRPCEENEPAPSSTHSLFMGCRAGCPAHLARAARRGCQCERTYMKSAGESPSHPETSYGRAAEGNCVVARRGGEQPEADLRSQTRVNPIRFTTAASLLASGEACRTSGNRFPPHPSFTGEKRAVVDGWGENAGKVSCGSVESCPGRTPREWSRTAVSCKSNPRCVGINDVHVARLALHG